MRAVAFEKRNVCTRPVAEVQARGKAVEFHQTGLAVGRILRRDFKRCAPFSTTNSNRLMKGERFFARLKKA
jgi:hypothetical protein